MRWWWLAWLVPVMTGGRCHRRKKMMGRGADGGCGTEERPCRPTSRVPAKISAGQPENSNKPVSLDIDFFSQARKALCERSPFDVAEDGSSAPSSAPTLPCGLASLLKQSDSRKKHKKSHSGADKKSSRPGERSRGSTIWDDTEEYFRDLALPDIDTLFEVSSLSSLATRKCFLIPFLENQSGPNANVSCGENVHDGNANGVVVKEDVKEEDEQFMEIDSAGADCSLKEEKGFSLSDSSSGLEWLLGARNRILLTSERPSKKRKLLGGDAGLDKVLVACPCEGNSSLCHFCCTGDTGKESNHLIVCSSCKVSVHQMCYGVHYDVEGSWLCSWCKQKNDGGDSVKPCMLCPKQGGALKPVHKSVDNGGSVEFAHLFCSQWMPEVYVEDLMKMEPIMNVGGIKETRRKLVCNICKAKGGACIRCSHGTCRTAFHPICAREARHRMEVWGKYGCDNVELRAFCSKHSEVQENNTTPQLGDPCVGRRNGEKISVNMETADTNLHKLGDVEPLEIGLSDSRMNMGLVSENGDAQNMGTLESNDSGDVNQPDSQNFILILKKLIDRGKVNVKDVASDIGISPDSLTAALSDCSLVPDVQCKIVKWLRDHAYLSALPKNLKVTIQSVTSKAEIGEADCSDGVTVLESDIPDPVAVKSVPPRRRTKSNVRILRDSKVICSSDEIFRDNGVVKNDVEVDKLVGQEPENSNKASIPDALEKSCTKPDGFQDSPAKHSPKSDGNLAKPSNCSFSQRDQSEEAAIPEQNASVNADQGNSVCSNVIPAVPDLIKTEPFSGFYVHPYIHKQLLKMQEGILLNRVYEFDGKANAVYELDGLREGEHHNQHSKCNDLIGQSDEVNLEQLVKARKLEELSPEDELEGEIIYYQHRLLGNAAAKKRFTDNLICKVAKSLPQEIDVARRNRWDAVLVNQYLCELREAKKQGRKERRHKEAQAVLAAATAAAAASTRISSFRKDAFDESANQENLLKLSTSNGRAGIYSQLMPRAKETLSRVAVPRTSLGKYSDFVQSVSDLSKEHPRSCDICRRSETIVNPILVCSSCKVAVHLDCYRSVKESTGPWYCELCEELLSSRCSGAPSVNFWEKPYFVAECGLCGGTTGAFRKSTDCQWVHAFCAEWVFESTFRRGQVNVVEGMETVSKGIDVCCICRRKHGVCIKCSYGHCQTTFHPSCARSAGFYMNAKSCGGKLQHKAYCEKHSLEQRAKAETQKHGIEELKSIKQIRVELERLRLLCERIIKREKIKRDLVLCSHEVLGFKRDHVARSVLVRSSFSLPDVSSESATTSLKGHIDGYKSCSEAIQRSDDVTVDSTVSVKHRIKVPVSMDTDQRTDDSSTSQSLFTRKPTERVPFSGKQIPHRPAASHSLLDDGEWNPKSRKHIETFEKELVMTSDQASVKNQRLPKGYFYIPVDCLPKEKQMNQDGSSGDPLEHDG